MTVTPTALAGEGIRTLLVVLGVGLFLAVLYAAVTVRPADHSYPAHVLGIPVFSDWEPLRGLLVRGTVVLAAGVTGAGVVGLAAMVPGEVPYPFVPDPGTTAAGRRRIVAGVFVLAPAVPELYVAAGWAARSSGAVPGALVAVALLTAAAGSTLVLSGLSTGRYPWIRVPRIDRLEAAVAGLESALRLAVDARPRTWGACLLAGGGLAAVGGGVVAGVVPGTIPANPPYRGPVLPGLLFAAGLPLVYAGAVRVLGRRPPGSPANWSAEARLLWVGGLAVAVLVAVPGTVLYVGESLVLPSPPSGRAATVGVFAAVGYFLGAWPALSGLALRTGELLVAGGRAALGHLRTAVDRLPVAV